MKLTYHNSAHSLLANSRLLQTTRYLGQLPRTRNALNNLESRIAEFEGEYNCKIPAAVMEFWQQQDLCAALHSWGTKLRYDGRPWMVQLGEKKCLVVGYNHQHFYVGVELDGNDDPICYFGFENEDCSNEVRSGIPGPMTFSEFVLDQMECALSVYQQMVAMESDPVLTKPLEYHAEAFALIESSKIPDTECFGQQLPIIHLELHEIDLRIAMFELDFGYTIPKSVREYWKLPRLVTGLHRWGDAMALIDPPSLISFEGLESCLEVGMHEHSGESICIDLTETSDNPICRTGFYGAESTTQMWENPDSKPECPMTFSELVLYQTKGAIIEQERRASGYYARHPRFFRDTWESIKSWFDFLRGQ